MYSPYNAPSVLEAIPPPGATTEFADDLLRMFEHTSCAGTIFDLMPSGEKTSTLVVFSVDNVHVRLILRDDNVIQRLSFVLRFFNVHILEFLLGLPNTKPQTLGRSLLLRLKPTNRWIHSGRLELVKADDVHSVCTVFYTLYGIHFTEPKITLKSHLVDIIGLTT